MTHGIICAPQPEAAKAGALMLQGGGNAFDATVACSITQGVLAPLMTEIGGTGNAVSMTHILGALSGVIVPNTGFILNGCMNIFDPRPNRSMSIAADKSYTSSMSPTLIFDDNKALIAIGAPGAAYIPQVIPQSIINLVDFSMTMTEATSAPRIAVTKNQIIEVSNRIPRFVSDEIKTMEYGLLRIHLSYTSAGMHGVKATVSSGEGGAGPGRNDVALCV